MKVTCAFWLKPVPVIVIAVSDAPAFTDEGCTAASVGAEPEMISESELVVFGVVVESKTLTTAVPGCASKVGEICAVTVCVKVFTCTSVTPVDAPFHRTVEFAVNPRPFNVTASALAPADAETGLIPLRANVLVPASAGSE